MLDCCCCSGWRRCLCSGLCIDFSVFSEALGWPVRRPHVRSEVFSGERSLANCFMKLRRSEVQASRQLSRECENDVLSLAESWRVAEPSSRGLFYAIDVGSEVSIVYESHDYMHLPSIQFLCGDHRNISDMCFPEFVFIGVPMCSIVLGFVWMSVFILPEYRKGFI